MESQSAHQQLIELVRQAKRIVALTGAGVSAESGIPTFRDAMDGHWSKYKPEQLATPQAFEADPARVSRWYDERRLAALGCEPNPGHYALAELERIKRAQGGSVTILTQNVDQLHQRAGSQEVIELHGSIIRWRCTRTGETQDHVEREPLAQDYPIKSPNGGLWRPDVVWFGETLPTRALASADLACQKMDLYLAIGTSGVVYPATGFIQFALDRDIPSVEINPQETPISEAFFARVREASGVYLPALVKALL